MSISVNNTYNNYANGVNSKEQETKKTSTEKSALEKLQEKYSGFDIKSGVVKQGSISSSAKGFQGVTINPAFLAKAENDEETAKKLDEMLSGVEEAQKWKENALSQSGLKLISSGFYIDENGNMSSWSVVEKKNSMFDSLNNQNAKSDDKVKEKKEKEAAEKKAAEKKEREEQLEELREKKEDDDEKVQTYEITVMGSDISSVNEKISEAISRLTSSNIPASRIAGIDIKA